MKTRTLVALAFLAIIGALVIWKVTKKDPHVRDQQASAPALPSLKAAEIDALEILEPGKPPVQLKKEGGEWKLVAPVQDRADQKNVETTLQSLEKMKLKHVVAESPDSYEKLGVRDEEAVKVVPKKGGQPLATLLVGKTGRQLRLEGKPQVWEVADLSRFSLVREVKMWRDREVVRFDRDQLASLEVTWPNAGKLVAQRQAPPAPPPEPGADPAKPKPPSGPDKWMLSQGQEAVGGTLDESVPSAMASTLTRLDAVDFVEGDMGPVRATVAVVLKDGTRKELLIGKEAGQDVWVKRPDSPRIWTIRKASADGLIKAPLQWRDKTLAKLDTASVQKIEVQSQKDGKLAFERVDDKTWKAVQPADLPELDSGKVSGLAAGFANLRAVSVVEAPDPKKTGLAKPTGTVTATTKDGKSVTLTVGALEEKNYYVKVSGRNEVFTVGEYVVSRYFKPAADFKKQPKPPAAAGMPAGHPPM